MACLPIPSLPMPTLPDGISVTPPTVPVPSLPTEFCCKLPIPPIPPIPITIPPVVLNSALLATLNAMTKAVVAYINSIPNRCPLE